MKILYWHQWHFLLSHNSSQKPANGDWDICCMGGSH